MLYYFLQFCGLPKQFWQLLSHVWRHLFSLLSLFDLEMLINSNTTSNHFSPSSVGLKFLIHQMFDQELRVCQRAILPRPPFFSSCTLPSVSSVSKSTFRCLLHVIMSTQLTADKDLQIYSAHSLSLQVRINVKILYFLPLSYIIFFLYFNTLIKITLYGLLIPIH